MTLCIRTLAYICIRVGVSPQHLLTMLDWSTRWPEAVLLRETTWVARYGVPANITSDRGVQFTSAMWTDWCSEYGVRNIPTTAFPPQANGMVERLHRQIKDALRARGSAATWADHLPWVMLGIRAAPKEESGTSAGEAALGHVLAVPGQLLSTTAPPVDTPALPVVIPVAKRTYAEAAATPALDGSTHVYVQCGGVGPPLVDNYAGPYLVLEKGPKVLKLQVRTREDVVTRDGLKPHVGLTPPAVADPTRRGRRD